MSGHKRLQMTIYIYIDRSVISIDYYRTNTCTIQITIITIYISFSRNTSMYYPAQYSL